MIKSIKFGFSRVWRGHALVLHYYLASLTFGLAILLPWWLALENHAGHSLVAERTGGLGNFSFLVEFLINNPGFRSILAPLVILSLGAYLLCSLFLSGGALASFAEERFQARHFWGSGAYFFPRFLRLFLWSLPLFLVPIIILSVWDGIIAQWDPYENIAYWSRRAAMLIALFCLFIHVRVLDYGRMHAVLNDERNMRRCLGRGLSFVRKRFFRALGMPFVIFLCATAISLLYLAATQGPAFSWLDDILLLLLAGQIHILLRLCFRLVCYGAEMHLYESYNPRPVQVDPAERLWLAGPAILDKTLARGIDDLIMEHDTEPEPTSVYPPPTEREAGVVAEEAAEVESETRIPTDLFEPEALEQAVDLPVEGEKTELMPAPPGQIQDYDPASDVLDLEDVEEQEIRRAAAERDEKD